jgi:hypothetical protein
MDDAKRSVAELRKKCMTIRKIIEEHHGVRGVDQGVSEETITLNKKDFALLMVALREAEILVPESIKRIRKVENIVLEFMHDQTEDPSKPGSSVIASTVRTFDDPKLSALGKETGSGPGARQSAVILYSHYQ